MTTTAKLRPRRDTKHTMKKPGLDEIFHTVDGCRRRGLIIDPGAANGLVGSETLRDLLQHIDQARSVKDTLEWKEKCSEVTGISGSADTTLGEIKMMLPMLEGVTDAHYRADVIGGEASMCPALVGNPALVNMKAVLASNWFENKDGLLIIPEGDNDLNLIRLLYTDSKHYLLPLDEKTSAANHRAEAEKARSFLMKAREGARNRWTDVRTWFVQPTTAKPKPSHNNHDAFEANLMNHKKTTAHEQEPPTVTTAATLKTAENTGGTKEIKFVDEQEPPTVTAATLETAENTGGHLDADSLSHQVLPTSVLSNEIMYAAEIEASFNRPTMYEGDRLPQDLPAQRLYTMSTFYCGTKEEYHNKSGHRVVNPDNYEQWRQTRKGNRKCQFWEIGTGAGRLSYVALLAGLSVAFPVDLRYGWNIADPAHQQYLLDAQERTEPAVIVVSPFGPAAFSGKATMTTEERDVLQAEEQSAINFVRELVTRQAAAGRGFIIETHWNTSSWRSSLLKPFAADLPGCRPRQRADHCAYGATDGKGLPVHRSIGLQSNFSLRSSTHRCRGHSHGHAGHQPQNSFGHSSKTTATLSCPGQGHQEVHGQTGQRQLHRLQVSEVRSRAQRASRYGTHSGSSRMPPCEFFADTQDYTVILQSRTSCTTTASACCSDNTYASAPGGV